ncbi:hypothetical protein [Streptomyces sp. NPDC000880]
MTRWGDIRSRRVHRDRDISAVPELVDYRVLMALVLFGLPAHPRIARQP